MPRRRFLVVGSVASLVAASAAMAATPTARYTVRFDATWSSSSHPVDYPGNAHWSPLVGGTHDASVHFWQSGELATVGIKDMAERGLTAPLASEVQAQVATGHAGVVILGGGIATGTGVATATFDISQQFPLATVVTMIAPSPDWFVGVTGLPLFSGGDWVELVRVALWAFDAGTDSGLTYAAPNEVTMPPQPIAPNSAAPFANGVALGTFTFTRIDAPISVTVPALGAVGLAALGAALTVLACVAVRRRHRPAAA